MTPFNQPRPAVDSGLPAVLRPALVGALSPFRPILYTLLPGIVTPIVTENPQRIAFFVIRRFGAAGSLSVSPYSDAATFGVPVVGPGGFAGVSADVWFSLTQAAWYAYSAAGEDVLVYELIRP